MRDEDLGTTSVRQSGSRVVQIVNTLAVADGGPSRNSFELNKALNALGKGDVNLFWLRGEAESSVMYSDGKLVGDLPQPGPRKIALRTNPEHKRAGVLQVYSALRQSEILILHGYYLWWLPLFVVFGKLSKCRVYIMPHGSLTLRQQRYSQLKKRLFEALAGAFVRKMINAFVTGSSIEKEELLARYPHAVVRVAGVGVSMPRRYKENDALHVPLRMLSMSRIAEKKRIDKSIDALGILSSSGIEAELKIAGEGHRDLVSRLEEHAEKLGVRSKVHFVGQLSGQEKSSAFLESDVFLLPSEDENFGIGFAEAVAHGLPCIVSANVAAAAALPKEAGMVLQEPSGVELAESIVNLSSSFRHQTAQVRAREFAEAEFSWASAAARWQLAVEEGGGD